MINIKQLSQKDVGRWVTYHASHGEKESGRIKSWNNTFIFVVYNCDNNWNHFQDYTAAATKPEQLTLERT